MHWRSHDMGSQIKSFNALNPVTITAGTTADGNEYDGNIYDRRVPGGTNSDLYLSAKVVVNYTTTIASTAGTLIILANAQHSSSTASTAFSDLNDADGSTGQSKTQTDDGNGVLEFDLDLAGAKRYVRIQVDPTLSATATDTAGVSGIMVLGGGDQPPAS